jgi:hypothetical protein
MSERPSLDAQISAVACDMLSRRGFLDASERRLRSPKLKEQERQTIELDRANTLNSQPALETAVDTLKWVRANIDDIREYQANKDEFRAFMTSKRGAA